jgi:hypothetical protein
LAKPLIRLLWGVDSAQVGLTPDERQKRMYLHRTANLCIPNINDIKGLPVAIGGSGDFDSP